MKRGIKTKIFSFVVLGILATLILPSVPMPLQSSSAVYASKGGNGGGGNGGNGGGGNGGNGSSGTQANGEVTAQLKNGVRSNTVARRHNLSVLDNLQANQYLFGIKDTRTVDQVVAELEADSDVIWAKPNYLLRAPEVSQRSAAAIDQRSVAYIDESSPSDYFDQYAISIINAELAGNIAQKGSGVTVAVIDTGVDTTHPTFNYVVPGYDFVNNDNDPSEVSGGLGYGHGTFVAGLIVLVARDAAIMPLRAFDPNGVGKASNISKAIRYAADRGAQVINMSFGMVETDTTGALLNAINYAASRGVVMIAAAGNDSGGTSQYPASDPQVLAVGATDSADQKTSFSNYGSWVGVEAPGEGIYSAYPGGLWAWWDGTSFSAAFVSSEAVLRLARGGGNVIQIIKDTAVPCCSGLLGSGRIDCLAAVQF
jgi:thermitase